MRHPNTMKTIITSTGDTPKSAFDKRFRKAQWFCLFDELTGETTFHKNTIAEEHGACKKAADLVKELKANKIISGHFGPGATRQLNKAGIQMIIFEKHASTVQEIIDQIK